jgi:hypothetical protein
VELDTLAEVKCVGLGVLCDFLAMRQIGNDGLATVARITPDEAPPAGARLARRRMMRADIAPARRSGNG